jgi:hypothetical protein
MILEEIDFFNLYKPVKNKLSKTETKFKNCMFGTTGNEFQFIKERNEKNVWTYIEDTLDGHSFIMPGLHSENRKGYFYTEEPYVNTDEIIFLNKILTDVDVVTLVTEFLDKYNLRNYEQKFKNYIEKN